MQHSSHILMIKPVCFDFNTETAVNNSFQVQSNDETLQEKAAAEFDHFTNLLLDNGIELTIVHDTPEPHTPDSIFPNNWISFHTNGTICLYPMFAVNRRQERKQQVLDRINEQFKVAGIVDLTGYENNGLFLEGTGSMVLDRDHVIAYACLSPRTNAIVLDDWCKRFGYRAVRFTATDANGIPIYHTNVMMCVADVYAVICLESIASNTEKQQVVQALQSSGKEIIDISFEQMNRFAGNMLQVHNKYGQHFLVMSSQAFHSLTKEQVQKLESFNPILHADITTIETNGGGSARCMMAEVFLPTKS